MHAAFKTVSNAIELAMIADSTALMQACKRGAPSARVSLNKCLAEVQKGSLCQHAKIFCSVQFLGQGPLLSAKCSEFFFGRRPLPFGGSHLRLPSGPAGIRTTTGSLSALARPTYQRNVQKKFWTGNLCQLCQGPLYGGIEHSLA